MIILDTNVVSEPLKPAPDAALLDWLNAQAPQTLYLTSVSLAELLSGIAAMPAGRRRDALKLALTAQVLPLFDGRILPFDTLAAQAFADVNTRASANGNPISFADCAIAAIASTHGFMLATRNTRDFRETGIEIFNPWTFSASR
ncbi:MAG: type II toxin-antitoxin system VapC family toxin [Pseudomonadota bacterium]|uniref:type II toxin-antitoxin system VapC family toxin n=1 Tax=Polaromonas sp. TaxID=1869339 RepID=UPI0017BD5E3C|nr:type II toxin-antitoxin system VapC family toxin [Polaromonas sp.]MBA3594129.1 type II toxin-antitoxin system VapC family toxin [Polaromonas sp.]MDQ3272240.1 type II toxin-antitoxin system VapC family toxin [Pseudomonadota bacterium]